MKIIPTFEMAVAKDYHKKARDGSYEIGDKINGEYDKFTILDFVDDRTIMQNSQGYLVTGSKGREDKEKNLAFDTPQNRKKYKVYLDRAELVPLLAEGDKIKVDIGVDQPMDVTIITDYTEMDLPKYERGYIPLFIGKTKKGQFITIQQIIYADWENMYTKALLPKSLRGGAEEQIWQRDGKPFAKYVNIEHCVIPEGLQKKKLIRAFGKLTTEKLVAAGYKAAE